RMRDHGDAVEVSAAVTGRFQPEAAELGGDVHRRQLAAAGGGSTALEQVTGEELEVGAVRSRARGAGQPGGGGERLPRKRAAQEPESEERSDQGEEPVARVC